MNSFERRVARLEQAARRRVVAGDDENDAGLCELLDADVLAGLKARRMNPVSLLPRELLAYPNGDPAPLPPNLTAGTDLFLAERGTRA